MKRLLVILILISPASFAAFGSDFNCEVKDMKMLNRDGSLTTPPNSVNVGALFVVNRMSGEVSGKLAPMGDMTVLDHGLNASLWKGTSTELLNNFLDGGNNHFDNTRTGAGLDMLEIDANINDQNKPFIYYKQFVVSVGICRVF